MKNKPTRIYLQIDDEVPKDVDFKDLGEVTWCDDKCNDRDIEYVRADRIREKIEEIDKSIELTQAKLNKESGTSLFSGLMLFDLLLSEKKAEQELLQWTLDEEE